MSVEPVDMQNVILPLIDRLIAPIASRLDTMAETQRQDTQQLHAKLDAVASVSHKVHGLEGAQSDLKGRLDDIETKQADHAANLARTQGRNDVLMNVMGWVGGPVVAALVLAGVAKLFNIDLGGL